MRIGVTCVKGKVNTLLAAISQLVFTRTEGPKLGHAPGGYDLEFRGKRLNAELKAYLIVALSRSAVTNRHSVLLDRNFGQLLRNQRTRKRAAKQSSPLRAHPGLQAGQNILLRKNIFFIEEIELRCAGEFCALLETAQFAVLAAVDTAANDFVVKMLLEPRDNRRCVQASGISKNNFFF